MEYSFRLYWVKDDGEEEFLDIGNKLEKFEYVYIGRLSETDLRDAKMLGVNVKNPYSLFIFKPGKYYYYMGIEDLYVSRRHAYLELKGNKILIKDHGKDGAGSENGTFINEKRLTPMKLYSLNHDDKVSLGFYTDFKVIYNNEPITIKPFTRLDKRDIEKLREVATINVGKITFEDKEIDIIVNVIQGPETPIVMPSGISVIAKPSPLKEKLKGLQTRILNTLNEMRKRGRNEEMIKKVVNYYDMVVKEDIEKFLNEKGKKTQLEKLSVAIDYLEKYASGYEENDRLAIENLEEVKIIIEVVLEVL
jgi:pSer/pThr/pTyr-binding forkhead associated (FHA) protein